MTTVSINPTHSAAAWLTVGNAASFADCSEKTIRRLVAAGELEASYLTPRALRISRASLDRLLAGNSTTQWGAA